jgi:hypothetical protein
MKKTPAILDNTKKIAYKITLKLQGGETAEFYYSNRDQARAHWDQIQGTGVVGVTPVREAQYDIL